MPANNRLQAILEKQDAADRAQVAESARQVLAESRAKEAWSRIVNEWRQVRGLLAQTVATANDAMTGGRKLYLQTWGHTGEEPSTVILMFEDNYPDFVQRKCVAVLDRDGTVFVSINESMPLSRSYSFNILGASIQQIEGIVFDFMELNI